MSKSLEDRRIAERTVLQFMGLHHCLACGVPLPNTLPSKAKQGSEYMKVKKRIKQIDNVLFTGSHMAFNKSHVLCVEQLRLIVKLSSLAPQVTENCQTSRNQPNPKPKWYKGWVDQMQTCFREAGIDYTFRGLHIGEEIISMIWPMCNSCNLQCSNATGLRETLEQELCDRNIAYKNHPMGDDECIRKLLPYIVTEDKDLANRDKTVQIMTFVLLNAYCVCLNNTKRWRAPSKRITKHGVDSYNGHRASAVSDVYLGYILFVILAPFLIARHRVSFISFYNDIFSLIFVPWYIGRNNENVHTISDMVLQVYTRHIVSDISELLTTKLVPACFHCIYNSVSVNIARCGAYLAVSDQVKNKLQDRVIVNQTEVQNLRGDETDYTQMQSMDIVDGLTVAFQGASFQEIDTLDWEEFEDIANTHIPEEKRIEYLIRDKFDIKIRRIYGIEATDKVARYDK
jgi:hypothetical protein